MFCNESDAGTAQFTVLVFHSPLSLSFALLLSDSVNQPYIKRTHTTLLDFSLDGLCPLDYFCTETSSIVWYIRWPQVCYFCKFLSLSLLDTFMNTRQLYGVDKHAWNIIKIRNNSCRLDEFPGPGNFSRGRFFFRNSPQKGRLALKTRWGPDFFQKCNVERTLFTLSTGWLTLQ